MKPSEVLVTDGTGTLGRRVVERLRAEGRKIRVMSRGGQPGPVKGNLEGMLWQLALGIRLRRREAWREYALPE